MRTIARTFGKRADWRGFEADRRTARFAALLRGVSGLRINEVRSGRARLPDEKGTEIMRSPRRLRLKYSMPLAARGSPMRRGLKYTIGVSKTAARGSPMRRGLKYWSGEAPGASEGAPRAAPR